MMSSFGEKREKREKIPKVVWVGQDVPRKRTGTFFSVVVFRKEWFVWTTSKKEAPGDEGVWTEE